MNLARKQSSFTDTKLYHFELGIPEQLQIRFGTIQLCYGIHAQRAAESDRNGRITLPFELNTDTAKVIEVEADIFGKVIKVVYRVPHCKFNDLLIVVIPERGFVKTVWLNKKSDLHKTLDRAKYSQPRRS